VKCTFSQTIGYNTVSPDIKIESFSNNVEVLQEKVTVVYEDKERDSCSQE
jgi:hypothetical protein